ncbi:hypothetical protein CEE37_13395 [candidate division LCP-89 bacterium B3_LCP]|uniref:Secretion system C-terminal sorting domain-containing protein n=1 Tax=candidate division LCP-89 bacterium B3_LCP TaxID=2012998 RepID=A0A532UST4_UNCL8|nr:MAG: hypothetical protein CEE37_13395 [candidate division LCP-89 bacterium B3_LCP]
MINGDKFVILVRIDFNENFYLMETAMLKTWFALLFAFVMVITTGYAADNDYPISPAGICTDHETQNLDEIGDIIRTIPAPQPQGLNTLVGSCWVEDTLIVFENVDPYTELSKFYKIDPADGTVLDEVVLPFDGWVMGASFADDGIWVVKWHPQNVIYKIGLDGSLISQFTPSTEDYSCRMVAYDDGNLWVGANRNGNDTKLYEMATDGTILEEYNTNSSVGWYMDGDIAAEAGVDSNIIVCDNLGGAVKRLHVSGGIVSVIDQFTSPVSFPDYAEGLTHDGADIWHNSAYGAEGVIWVIDDGIGAPPPPPEMIVELTYVSGSPVPAGGGTLYYSIWGENQGLVPLDYDIWIDKTYESTDTTTLIIREITNYQPGWQINRPDAWFPVPSNWPGGNYEFRIYSGWHPEYDVWHTDAFSWSKSGSVDLDYDFEANLPLNASDPFEDIGMNRVNHSVPSKFEVISAYPNPFNPMTTISFTLPNASLVKLEVFDINGRAIKGAHTGAPLQLVNGWRDAGVHEVVFDGSELASGIYLYRLEASGSGATPTTEFIASGKMVLLK